MERIFLKMIFTINENVSFTDHALGILFPDCSKSTISWKNDNDLTIFQHDVIVNFLKLPYFSYKV